jgi:hypothetical protein
MPSGSITLGQGRAVRGRRAFALASTGQEVPGEEQLVLDRSATGQEKANAEVGAVWAEEASASARRDKR